MAVKVKDLARFLNATDPECTVMIEVLTPRGWVQAGAEMVMDEKLGVIKLTGYEEKENAGFAK